MFSSRSRSSSSSSCGREVFRLFAINEGEEVEDDDAGDVELIFELVVLSMKRTIGG